MHTTSVTTGKAVEAKLKGEIKRLQLACITRKSDRKREKKRGGEGKRKENAVSAHLKS